MSHQLHQILVLIIVLAVVVIGAEDGGGGTTKTTAKCSYLPDELVGRCWGLTGINEKHFDWVGVAQRTVASPADCEALCCEMRDSCITWQFRGKEKSCMIGKHVRLGKEPGATGLWCEPLPPAKWNGRKKIAPVAAVTAAAGEDGDELRKRGGRRCEWGEQLPRQCWHLGPERLNATGGRMGPRGCAAGCCKAKHCVAWQQLPDRGCFYNTDFMAELHCDATDESYVGKRKERAV